MHPFYEDEVQALRDTYGDFLLINTNFNHVNAFGPDMNLFQPVKNPDEIPKFGRAAKGMSREYAEDLWNHKLAVFKDFQELIPKLEQAFPQLNIVVRPHPTERHGVYNEIATRCSRVHVTNQGNVVPWILATKAVLHNGCTTGIEAFVMGVPAISYRASVCEKIDNGFYRLPNAVSDHCFDFDQLQVRLDQILSGNLVAANSDERRAVVSHYLASQSGPLACERMVDVLESLAVDGGINSGPSAVERLQRRMIAGGYHLYKRLKPKLPGSHNRPEFQRHRYPSISIDTINLKIERIQQLLNDNTRLNVMPITDVLFQIKV